MSKNKVKKNKKVIVTTANYGIYYGKLESTFKGEDTLVLRGARHVHYYAAGPGDAKGTWSLATHGPAKGSKLSPEMPRILVSRVSCVAECPKDAVKAFANAGWGR